jgi:hypothetical protein
MESKFHRWWLGSCVAALLLASWAGGFSVAVTAVFVVVYLTGVTLVGPEDVADVGLAAVAESPEDRVLGLGAAPAVESEVHSEQDGEPYPDDETPAEPHPEAPADIDPNDRETADAFDTAAAVVVVETPDAVNTAVIVESPDVVDTGAVLIESADTESEDADEPEPSPA